MSTITIKKRLHDVVDNADSLLLKMLYAVAKEYAAENYTLPGKPMTEKTLKLRIHSASERIKSGRFTTQADLEKEMKGW